MKVATDTALGDYVHQVCESTQRYAKDLLAELAACAARALYCGELRARGRSREAAQ
jgi:hypothetical protein